MKIYKSQDEMYKDGIEIRKKAFKEIDAIQEEYHNKKIKQKKNLYILIIIFFIILIIFLIKNPIYINSKIPYGKSRYYVVTVNDMPISVQFLDIQKITIIPYMVYIYRGNFGVYSSDDSTSLPKISYNDRVEIDIKSYECYIGKNITGCESNKDRNKNMKEINDEIFTLTTKSMNDFNTLEYNGKLIKDIDKYVRLEEEYDGQYDRQTIDDFFEYSDQYIVEITAKHKNVTTYINFYIERFKEED